MNSCAGPVPPGPITGEVSVWNCLRSVIVDPFGALPVSSECMPASAVLSSIS